MSSVQVSKAQCRERQLTRLLTRPLSSTNRHSVPRSGPDSAARRPVILLVSLSVLASAMNMILRQR